jgi:hypothetical protein
VGVIAPLLIPADVRADRLMDLGYAHWRQRLGHIGPENIDMWWTSTSESEAAANAEDMADRIRADALPLLNRLATIDALAAVWAAGQSPGLTAMQRQHLLRQFEASTRGERR